MIRDYLYTRSIELTEDEADTLRLGPVDGYDIEVRPPSFDDAPATVNQFVQSIYEPQQRYLGLQNVSPVAAFEIRRSVPDSLKLQFWVPTKRLERKVRAHLSNEVPEVGFSGGTRGLPVSEGDSVGGGMLSVGRRDWYPLRMSFSQPPNNSVISALHRHAMQDTKFIIQVLFQPAVGQPLRQWWWTRRAYKRIGYLRKEKQKLWGSRSPTPREKTQAKAVERKAGSPRYWVTIRFVVVNAEPNVRSRVKEVGGAFNVFENGDTGQYLNTVTVETVRRSSLRRFAAAVAGREFQGWSRKFQASTEELAGLVSIPDRQQENLTPAKA